MYKIKPNEFDLESTYDVQWPEDQCLIIVNDDQGHDQFPHGRSWQGHGEVGQGHVGVGGGILAPDSQKISGALTHYMGAFL